MWQNETKKNGAAIPCTANARAVAASICFLFWFGCSPLQCDVVQSSYWKDKNDSAHPYKQTLRCFKADGTSEDLTVVASKMPLPVPKCEGGSK